MDSIQYGQFYNDAMSGMDSLFDDMKDSMKYFNKKCYPGVFENMTRKYGKVFLCVEEIYNESNDKEKWLKKLSERFTAHAKELIGVHRWKFQKDNALIDCNMFVVGFVIPAILEYPGNMSEPFAQTLIDCWNETFGTSMECGNYDRIYNGFSTSIFGIKFGK